MDDRTDKIRDLLHEAGEVHHVVYRITDGADDDWASFYADWLIAHSELPDVLGGAPVRSHLVHELVASDQAFPQENTGRSWETFYAERIVTRFG
jgi:hypothetical protein